jgi:predicted Zn-dependent protease with MMP-like domain
LSTSPPTTAATSPWADRTAPTLDDFDVLARAAWEQLPQHFRDLCKGVVFQIHDFADDQVLKDLEIESPFDLMGLYHGVHIGHKDAASLPHGPDYVFLYRRPILDYWMENEETLGHLVTHVLVHEIGHHFGLSDADMEAIEAEAERDESA